VSPNTRRHLPTTFPSIAADVFNSSVDAASSREEDHRVIFHFRPFLIPFIFCVKPRARSSSMSGDPRHAVARTNAPTGIKLKNMDEKNMHNLFLKNMAGLIEETKNPSTCANP
jgi:hypothetical protein